MQSVGPVLTRLRQATAQAHQALEDHVNAVDTLSSTTDRRAMVARYYQMHASADSALESWLEKAPDLDQAARRRTPLLEKDMAALGLNLPPHATLPRVSVTSLAEALGFLYVLEGSSLGGRVITKGLISRGASLAGLSFLDPYGRDIGERWRSFILVLEREGGRDADGVVRGALAGFRHAAACLLAPEPAL